MYTFEINKYKKEIPYLLEITTKMATLAPPNMRRRNGTGYRRTGAGGRRRENKTKERNKIQSTSRARARQSYRPRFRDYIHAPLNSCVVLNNETSALLVNLAHYSQ